MNERRSGSIRKVVGACQVLALVGVFALAGCGGGDATVPVTGTVSYKGQPVKGGQIMFQPIGGKDNATPGKPAQATVKDDGTFSLTTNREGDGAVVGRHRLVYNAPMNQLDVSKNPKPGDVPPPSPYDGLVPKDKEVEVKSGPNTVAIELIPGKK